MTLMRSAPDCIHHLARSRRYPTELAPSIPTRLHVYRLARLLAAVTLTSSGYLILAGHRVDVEWAKEKLRAYVEAFTENDRDRSYDWHNADDLNRGLPTVKRILDAVKEPTAIFGGYDYGTYKSVKDAANRGLGILDDWGVVEEKLQPDAPQLAADSLHDWVWAPARSLWNTAHFREAVQVAATSVNARLQSTSLRRDVSDSKLVQELFSDKPAEPGKARLRWPGNSNDENVRSMQSGIMHFGSGCFRAIRNKATHELTELSEQEALERLAALSLFCHWVQQCELVAFEGTP